MINSMKIILKIIFILLITKLSSQSGLQLTEYYLSPIQHNPSYVGVTDGYYLKGNYSTQWQGFEESPNTQLFEGHYKFNNKNFAAGLSILNDEFGIFKNLNLEANFALHLIASADLGLSFGVKVGVNSFSLNFSNTNIYDPSEYIFNKNLISSSKPTFGSGFYLYGKNWFAGISSPNLLSNSIDDEIDRVILVRKSQIFSTFGYNFILNNFLKLNSQILTRSVKGSPFSYLISNKLIYQNKFSFALHFQPNTLTGLMFFLPITNKIRVTYSRSFYSKSISKIKSGNSFGVSFQIFKQKGNWSDKEELDKPFMIR